MRKRVNDPVAPRGRKRRNAVGSRTMVASRTELYIVDIDGVGPCTILDIPVTSTLEYVRNILQTETEEELIQAGKFLFQFNGQLCPREKEAARQIRHAAVQDHIMVLLFDEDLIRKNPERPLTKAGKRVWSFFQGVFKPGKTAGKKNHVEAKPIEWQENKLMQNTMAKTAALGLKKLDSLAAINALSSRSLLTEEKEESARKTTGRNRSKNSWMAPRIMKEEPVDVFVSHARGSRNTEGGDVDGLVKQLMDHLELLSLSACTDNCKADRRSAKLFIPVIVDEYFRNAACLQTLEWAIRENVDIKPVVTCHTDKKRIGELIKSAPACVNMIQTIDWATLPDKDEDELWKIKTKEIHDLCAGNIQESGNTPGKWHIFISHSRRSASAVVIAETLYGSFKERKYDVWLDVKMHDKSVAAMKEGVKNSKLFVAIITGPCLDENRPGSNQAENAYFARDFCVQELRWAMEYNIPIQCVMTQTDKSKTEVFKEQAPNDVLGIYDKSIIYLDRDDLPVWNAKVHSIIQQFRVPENEYPELKQLLHPTEFETDIDAAVERFHLGTRKWLFVRFEEWVRYRIAGDSRVLVFSEEAGIGKTEFTSMVIRSFEKWVVAYQFCERGDIRKNDARCALRTIVFQLATQIDEYRSRLVTVLQKWHEITTHADGTPRPLHQLFHNLIVVPLNNVAPPDELRRVICIDAIDECEKGGKNELLDCLCKHFQKLPSWLGLFLTMRPQKETMDKLRGMRPFKLLAGPRSKENMADIHLYIKDALKHHIADKDLERGVDILAQKSNGMFINAYYEIQKVRLGHFITLEELAKYPDGMCYEMQFQELFPGGWDDNATIWKIIEAATIAREPLHINALQSILDFKNEKVLHRGIAKLSCLFAPRDHCIHAFHKSIVEWLTDPSREREDYFVDTAKVNEWMGKQCLAYLARTLSSQASSVDVMENQATMYAAKNCVAHLCKGGLAQQARELLFNFDWLLLRARIGPPHALIEDANRVVTNIRDDLGLELLLSALRLSQFALQVDPWQLAGQLLGRLKGYAKQEEPDLFIQDIHGLIDRVKAWDKCSWWSAVGQTFEPAGGVCIHTFVGHAHSVNSVAYSPDGKTILSASHDKTVKVWDADTGRLLTVLKDHADKVNTLAFAPDSSKYATGSTDKTVKVWNMETYGCMHTLKVTSVVTALAFGLGSSTVARGGSNGEIEILNIDPVNIIASLEGHTGIITGLVYVTEDTLASSSADKFIKIWSIVKKECLFTLCEHEDVVFSLAVHESVLLSTSQDNTIKVWNVSTGASLLTWSGCGALQARFSPDGQKIASASLDKSVRIWDMSTQKCVSVLKGHTDRVLTVAFSPDGLNVVSGAKDKTVKKWTVCGRDLVPVMEGHADEVTAVTIGTDIVVSGSSDMTVKVWSIETGECLATLEGHTGAVTATAISSDGVKILSGSCDNSVALWSTVSSEGPVIFEGHQGCVRSVAFSPDRSKIASGSDDKTVKVWDFHEQVCLFTFDGHAHGVYSAAFSPDGKHLVTGDNTTISVSSPFADWVNLIEGDSVADHRHNRLKVWNLMAAECVFTSEEIDLFGHRSVGFTGNSVDGLKIFSGYGTGRIECAFDLKSGKQLSQGKCDPNVVAKRCGFQFFSGDEVPNATIGLAGDRSTTVLLHEFPTLSSIAVMTCQNQIHIIKRHGRKQERTRRRARLATVGCSMDTDVALIGVLVQPPMYRAEYDFVGVEFDALSFNENDTFDLLVEYDEEWLICRDGEGHEGFVPKAYVSLVDV